MHFSSYLWVATATFALHVSANSFAQQHLSAPTTPKKVIVQMFQWTWDSIAAECTNFLGPAGYGYVQVSPPAEHITGPEWWTDYQPVSYILTSKRGNRDQFQHMISICNAAGVGVIVDTIFNHMAGGNSGTGIAGSTFTHYVYPGIYQYQDFHHCGLVPNDKIWNFSSRLEAQTCELENLADLATDTEYVRGRLAAYANDLISLGVAGFRLDAAKHIPSTDISNILSRLSRPVYITQEVASGDTDEVTAAEYTGNGNVQEFRYLYKLRAAFNWDGISGLKGLENFGWVSSSNANVFVANHDTERGDNSPLNYNSPSFFFFFESIGESAFLKRLVSTQGPGHVEELEGRVAPNNSPSNVYILVTVFSLAYPYGTPTILSSYHFPDSKDGRILGAPNGGVGACSGSCGSHGWLCQHRWPAIAGMVPWFNAVNGAGLTNWQTGSNQQIAFGRGSIGFVAINNADWAWSTTFTTSLPDDTYCDVISGTSSSGVCTGASFNVTGGFFSTTVPPRSAIAIYTGATGSSSNSDKPVAVTFTEGANTIFGDNIFVVGSIDQLGSWAPDKSIAMSAAEYPTWSATISLPVGTTFQYKYIKKSPDGSVVWESGPNRVYTTMPGAGVSLCDAWRGTD
ncbi:alpha-amylase [Ceratobasidium sp. AG-Ba]|nr:alpha-amylase [Ceratobasidium sp. AG-Ba]